MSREKPFKNDSKFPKEKRLINLFVSILFILLIFAAVFYSSIIPFFDQKLHINFLDVGQGDSIHIRDNNFDILVDGGPDKKVLSELGETMPFWDHKIELMVLTHPHADHITGLIEVLERYEVGQILLTDAIHTSAEYIEWLNTIKNKKIPVSLVQKGYNIENLPDKNLKIQALWPAESYKNKSVDNLNNTSIILRLDYYNNSVLLTGDAEEPVQKKLLGEDKIKQLLKNLTILKVPHHGSSNSAYESFIGLINPKVAIVSVGEHNKFGHPTDSTLEKYQKIGSKILRTDKNGRVEVIMDKGGYTINY